MLWDDSRRRDICELTPFQEPGNFDHCWDSIVLRRDIGQLYTWMVIVALFKLELLRHTLARFHGEAAMQGRRENAYLS